MRKSSARLRFTVALTRRDGQSVRALCRSNQCRGVASHEETAVGLALRSAFGPRLLRRGAMLEIKHRRRRPDHRPERRVRRAAQERRRAGSRGHQQAAGGVLGQKITITVGDDVSDPKQGVSVANKFVGGRREMGRWATSTPASPCRRRRVYAENGILHDLAFGLDQPDLSPSVACGTPSAPAGVTTSRAAWPASLPPEELQGQEDRRRPRQDHLWPGPCRRNQEGAWNAGGVKPKCSTKASMPARRTSRRSISKIKASKVADYLYYGGLHTEGRPDRAPDA